MKACPDCDHYLAGNPHVVGACASVGIEAKRSTADMVTDHLRVYHDGGHQHCDVYRSAPPVDGGPRWLAVMPRVVLTAPLAGEVCGFPYDNGYTLTTQMHGSGECERFAPDPSDTYEFVEVG